MNVPSPPARPGLVGRDTERDVASRALRGEPGNVVLHGPAGIGKTHLASAIAAELAAEGRRVRRVVASAASMSIPLGALAALLPLLPEPVSADSARSGADDLSLLRHAIDAIGSLAAEGDLLLVVDDAQHLDRTSALAVQQLAADRTIGLLLTVRSSDPVPEPIAALWGSGDALRIDLEVLDDDGVRALLGATLGGPVDGPTVRRIGQLSEGNPMFALELAATGRRSGALAERDGVWRVQDGWRPSVAGGRLSDLLTVQLRALDVTEREGLEVIALAEVLSLADAERLVGSATLEALEQHRLIAVTRTDRGDEVRAWHPLIAELIRAEIGSRRRRRLFGELAAHTTPIEGAGGEATMRQALWLLESGADEPDLYAWATRFARFANDFETGLRFADAATASVKDVEVLVLAGEMAYHLGRYDVSDEWLRAGADVARTDEELALVVINHLSTVYWGLGDWAACEGLISDYRDAFPASPWAADLEGLLASLSIFSGHPLEALEGVAALRRRDDPRARVELAFVEAGALTLLGATDRAVAVATEGYGLHVALGEQIGLGSSVIHIFTSLAALSSGGRLDQAEAMGSSVYEAVVATPNAFAMVLVAMANGHTALAQGRPRTAERWFREGAAVARDNIADDHLRWCLGGLALSLAMVGDVSAAADALAEARTIGRLARLHDVDLDLAAAWIDAQSGDLSGAVDRLLSTAPRWASVGYVGAEARVLQACVSLDAAHLVADRLEVIAAEVESPLVALGARQAAAVVGREVDELEVVASAYLDLGARFSAAEAYAQAAGVARRSERSQRALGLDRRGRELAARCEGARNPTLFESAELAPLTRREREIALLAANGLRSKDIAEQLGLSSRTVENHLHNAFAKLGISDRTALGEALGSVPDSSG